MSVALSLVVGCSSDGKDNSSTPEKSAAWEIPDKPYPDARDQMHALFSGSGTRLAAIEELVWRCMRDKGQMYVKLPPSEGGVNPTMVEPGYGQSVAEARQGYPDKAAEDEARPDPYRNQTEAQREAWGEAFFGPKSMPEITIDLPGGGQIGTPPQGCLAEARKQVYGSLEAALGPESFAGSLPVGALNRAAADPKMRELNSSWSSCMAEKGYPGLADPGEARAKAASGNGVAIAVADAECEKKLGYAEQRRHLEDRYLTAALIHHEPEVTALQETNRAALEKARRILSS